MLEICHMAFLPTYDSTEELHRFWLHHGNPHKGFSGAEKEGNILNSLYVHNDVVQVPILEKHMEAQGVLRSQLVTTWETNKIWRGSVTSVETINIWPSSWNYYCPLSAHLTLVFCSVLARMSTWPALRGDTVTVRFSPGRISIEGMLASRLESPLVKLKLTNTGSELSGSEL